MENPNIGEKHFIHTAVSLARMYGVAETLRPLPYKSNEEIFHLMQEWTSEYIKSGEKDLIHFFEIKIAE